MTADAGEDGRDENGLDENGQNEGRRGEGGRETGAGLAAAGAYAPRLRVSAEEFAAAWDDFAAAGIESVAVPDADEDALTMAAEASRRALHAWRDGGDAPAESRPARALGGLYVATTTPPLEEEALTARLGSFFGVPGATPTRTFTGHAAAGADALLAGLDAVAAGDGPVLVVATDCPRGAPDEAEGQAAGAGAAAFVLTAEAPAPVVETATFTAPFPGERFRPRGAGAVEGLDVTAYDREAYRTVVAGAAERLDADGVDALALTAPDGERPYRVAGDLGHDADAVRRATAVHGLGDTGAASAPLGLAVALAGAADDDDTAASRPLLAAYGSGATAAAAVVAHERALPIALALDGDVDLSYARYLRRRGEVTSGPPDGGGAYVSVPSWRRTLAQRHRLLAGRCVDCGALAFPPEGACPDCRSLAGYDDEPLAREGTVRATTTVAAGGAPPEFAEQTARSGAYASAIASFPARDGPGEAAVPVQVVLHRGADGRVDDDATGAPERGDAVRTVPRRLYTQEDLPRYALKAVAAADVR